MALYPLNRYWQWTFPASTVVSDYNDQRGYKQEPITTNVLPYTGEYLRNLWIETYGPTYQPVSATRLISLAQSLTSFNDEARTINNRAATKFWGKLSPQSEMGAAIAEYAGSLSMIQERSSKILKAYSALKRGNFRKFVRALGTRAKNKHRKTKWTRPKDASAIWLEYWFGWAPLLGDLYNAVNQLQEPLPDFRISASSGGTAHRKQAQVSYNAHTFVNEDMKIVVKTGATIKVINPYLFRANQLGLVNPASVAWELLPFSFVYDWFTPVGAFLNEMTATYGLDISDAYTTVFVKGTQQGDYLWRKDVPSKTYGCLISYSIARTSRSKGIAQQIAGWSLPDGLSLTRAATAVALCLSLFTKG